MKDRIRIKEATMILILLLAGLAGAAVYHEITKAKLFWERPIENASITTLIECGAGYSNSCNIGQMTGDTLQKNIYHCNEYPGDAMGVVKIRISCTEGMVNDTNGVEDFVGITFTDPTGAYYECNDMSYIERIAQNVIEISPPMTATTFQQDTPEFSNIIIEFVPNAYGDYSMEVWVENV